MALVTLFKGFNKPVESLTLAAMIERIKSEEYKEQVERIRLLFASNQKEEANLIKKQLPAFTPSGNFEGGRTMTHLVGYSHYIVLDFDKLNENELILAYELIINEPCTAYCFRSPSNYGLKLLVEVTSAYELHAISYNQVANFYEKLVGLPIDRSGKDVTRLCFVSYDPLAFINKSPRKFEVRHHSIEKDEILEEDDYSIRFTKCRELIDYKIPYKNGNRNNHIYGLACWCNRDGIPKEVTLLFMQNQYDLDPREVRAAVNSAYGHHSHEFGSKQVAITKMNEKKGQEDDILLNMPFIPKHVYDELPDLLKQGCEAFDTAREKDMFLTGAIAILSGCLNNVEGSYDQRTVYPNLNSFIVAPAASGKGAFAFAKTLGMAYHRKLLQASSEAKKTYEMELQQYKNNQKARKKHALKTDEEEPQKPPFKLLFIPGNSSSAAVIQHLRDSDGKGIFCETEADTIANSLKQDWGGYSDLLRKAFHHESVSYSRKTNNEYFEIEKPQLSMAISGTPSQVIGLVNSAEDGLFSRLIFYVFKNKIEWRNVAPHDTRPNLNMHFDELSSRVLEVVEFLEAHPTFFNLTDEQWSRLNDTCSTWLYQVATFVSEEASSTVKRLGLILYRISMVLSALRKVENGDAGKLILCHDADFSAALAMAEVYKEHALYMFGTLPKTNRVGTGKVKDFYDQLPNQFERKDAIVIGDRFGIKPRTVDKYLSDFQNNKVLFQHSYGVYAK